MKGEYVDVPFYASHLQLLLRLEPYKIACHFYYFSRVGGGGFSPRLRCFLQDNEVTDYRDAK